MYASIKGLGWLLFSMNFFWFLLSKAGGVLGSRAPLEIGEGLSFFESNGLFGGSGSFGVLRL